MSTTYLTGELAGYTVTTVDSAALYVGTLAADGCLAYIPASDEWVDETGEPLPENVQQAAERLRTARQLPGFEATA